MVNHINQFPMKKALKGLVKVTSLAILTSTLTIVIVILFPQRLFANKISYKKFIVCSNKRIDEDIKPVLDSALILVQKSELYDPGYQYNIILCNNSLYNKIDNEILGTGPAARARLHNVLIKVRIDPKSNLAFPTFPKACEINLTNMIAHEMLHCLQANRYGLLKFNPFKHPKFWKLEGYPEYISKQKQLSAKGYSLISEIETYINLESKATGHWILSEKGGCEVPDCYYKGRLMIEYLIDIRHLSYDQILRDTSSENAIFREMIEWKDGTKSNQKTQNNF
jgi:hypothetical protein